MKKLTLISLIALFLSGFSLSATAADFTGMWTLSIDTPRGTQHPTLSVENSDGTLTGTYGSLRGPIAIEAITVNGNNFSFPLTIEVPIGEIEVTYRGTFNTNELQGTVRSPRGEVPFTGTRN